MTDLRPWNPRLVKKVIMKTLERKVIFCTWLGPGIRLPVMASVNILLSISEDLQMFNFVLTK